MTILQGVFALATLLAIAFALSEDRRAIPLRVVVGGVFLQIALALLLMATKTVLNEFVAYLDLSQLPENALSPRSLISGTLATLMSGAIVGMM